MEPLNGADPWVVRTDFSNDDIWMRICNLISAPQIEGEMQFFAYVDYVNDDSHREQQPVDLVRSLPDTYPDMVCFAVDRDCIENPEHPILVIGFYPSDNESFERLPHETPAADIATFRAVPSQIQGIQNNLSLANMDFEDFADSVDKDGVFRGFSN
ncbi:MAG: hypothetical protein ACFB14_14645 [Leptolyngbyaceae cyanobacterium]